MQLYPYEGLEVENKKIMFGLTPDEVTALLGRPENDTYNRAQYNDPQARDFYEETRGSFKFFYEEDKLVMARLSNWQDLFKDPSLLGSVITYPHIQVQIFPDRGIAFVANDCILYGKEAFECARIVFKCQDIAIEALTDQS